MTYFIGYTSTWVSNTTDDGIDVSVCILNTHSLSLDIINNRPTGE